MPAEPVNPWWSGKTSPGSITPEEFDAVWNRILELPRNREPGRLTLAVPVNRYPGPLWQSVPDGLDPYAWSGVGLFMPPLPHRARMIDRNAGWGHWPAVATLPYEDASLVGTVDFLVPEGVDRLWVPLYDGDPERRVWRRRKWWGRGPIIFAPWGRPRLVHGLLRDRPALLWPASPSTRGCR